MIEYAYYVIPIMLVSFMVFGVYKIYELDKKIHKKLPK